MWLVRLPHRQECKTVYSLFPSIATQGLVCCNTNRSKYQKTKQTLTHELANSHSPGRVSSSSHSRTSGTPSSPFALIIHTVLNLAIEHRFSAMARSFLLGETRSIWRHTRNEGGKEEGSAYIQWQVHDGGPVAWTKARTERDTRSCKTIAALTLFSTRLRVTSGFCSAILFTRSMSSISVAPSLLAASTTTTTAT